LPFLRFTRDKRGYETTSLVHSDRGRQGRAHQRVLYWFRSPPNVKVGRPALDQDAIRWIEEHNPDIEFDWNQILQATPPAAPPPEDARGRRQRRTRTMDRPARPERPERRAQQAPRVTAGEPSPAAEPEPIEKRSPVEEERGRVPFSTESSEKGTRPLSSLAPEAEALEQITHPDTEEAVKLPPSAVETVLGREQLIRFRARYAELQARIIERAGEPARMEELRAKAEPLNPDSWVTVEEARKGVEEFETKVRELRSELGLKRRRRSRRGGRKRRTGQPGSESAGAQTASAGPSSNSPDGALPEEPGPAEPSEEVEQDEEDPDGNS